MSRIILPSSAAAALLLGLSGCGVETPSSADAPDAPALASSPHTGVRSLKDLGTFGWQHGFGFEINDAGAIAGRTDMGPPLMPAVSHAVYWSARTGPIDLGTLGGVHSETRGLNDNGLVVGLAQKPGDAAFFQRHPTVWRIRGNAVETIEIGPVVQGQAEDVNNRGVVVGWTASTVTGPPTAFRWTERGGLQPIPPLGGMRSAAGGINDRGDVAGHSTVSPPFVEHAVVWWADGTVTDIGTLGGNASARSINQRGEVAGFAQPCPGCLHHAIYWSAQTGLIDLGTFGGTRSFAFEVDEHGRVTGWYETPGPVRHPFVWTREGGKVDLPTLGGALAATGSINARGQVTGQAQDASGALHAVIWQLGPDPH